MNALHLYLLFKEATNYETDFGFAYNNVFSVELYEWDKKKKEQQDDSNIILNPLNTTHGRHQHDTRSNH